MSKALNNEYCVALEGKDLQANAMAVDNSGSFVLLAGRRCIAIRNLDEDKEAVQKFPRQSKYEVNCAEWNPTKHHRELCAISSNQRLEIFTWASGGLCQCHSLRAHTRVITDLNWHQFDPNIITSCSVDTFIHNWDLRDTRRPSLSLSAIAEASQIRWNRHSHNIIATAHDGDVKIWDQRKGTAPVQYISAHLSKIHGLDWSYSSESQFATSSQDRTIKFFDMNTPRRAEYVITTNAPVWRARYTPFGDGLITVVVPQLRRGENSLLLWNIANRAAPIHTFIGHRDVVLDFEWRRQKPGEKDFQLVTWSKDQTLLIWKIQSFLQKLCGYEPEDGRDGDEDGVQEATSNVEMRDQQGKVARKLSTKIQLLQQEFSLLNVDIPNLEVHDMDWQQRTCGAQVVVNSFTVHLQVSFPNAYPHGVPPIFQILPSSNVSEKVGRKILQALNSNAQQWVSKNHTCLEPCLRQIIRTLDQLSTVLDNDLGSGSSAMESPGSLDVEDSSASNALGGGYNDAYIPFPRTSGAKFCSVGMLVCFGRPAGRRAASKTELAAVTPRSLSAMDSLMQPKHMTVSAYYYQKQRASRSLKTSSSLVGAAQKMTKAVVHVYDALGLFFVNKPLAEQYILDGEVRMVCRHNAAAAKSVGRWDLVQAWTLVELASNAQLAVEDEDVDWARHPFGNQLMQSLISHYALQSDIQMAAMLSCLYWKIHNTSSSGDLSSFKSFLSPNHLVSGKRWLKSGGSPYHTIPPTDVTADGWMFFKSTRSTSLDNLKMGELGMKKADQQRNEQAALHEYYKSAYAETLHRWGLLYKRCEVVRFMGRAAEPHKGVIFLTDCHECLKPSKSCCCTSCKKLSLQCVVCHVSVRGSANSCVFCGHGGHSRHLEEWFSQRDVCPSGCGCHCLQDSNGIFHA